MSTLASRLRSWIRRTFGRPQLESEMETEIRFHVDAFTEDLVRQGVPRVEAMRRARMEFGAVENAKEECREATGATLLENPRSLPKNSDRAPVAACPLLPGALAVALGLVRVHLPHFLQQILRVRPRNIGRARTAFVSLLRTPRSGIKWLLHALRHGKNLRRNGRKAS